MPRQLRSPELAYAWKKFLCRQRATAAAAAATAAAAALASAALA